MRAPNKTFDYYGQPGEQPYTTPSEFGDPDVHAFCQTRAEWEDSRILALGAVADDIDLSEDRMRELERIQRETAVEGAVAAFINAHVLIHGDLSDRNILLDPSTLETSGVLHWKAANVAPAYFDYADTRLSGGHHKDRRKVLLEILRGTLRVECGCMAAEAEGKDGSTEQGDECSEKSSVA